MPQEEKDRNHKYFIEAVSKALDILDILDSPAKELSLTELAKQVGLSRSSTFRFLYTLEEKRWVERAQGARKFRRVAQRRRHRIGYAMLTNQFPYALDVTAGLQTAAARHGAELIITDNCFSAEIAVMNAQMFIKQGVDFVIECQADERVAPLLGHLFAQASIPCIAIDIPQPGAVFFGANNFQAGLLAGNRLGLHVKERWNGEVGKIILLERKDSGPIPQARITGSISGLQEVLGGFPEDNVFHIECRGTLQDSYRICRNIFSTIPAGTKLVVAPINDPAAIGAVRALEDMNRGADAAVVGQNATLETRLELRKENSCLIGSVGYFPEKYGEEIFPLLIKILNHEAVPPAVYIDHIMITRENVDSFYPNDSEQAASEHAKEGELIHNSDRLSPVATLFS